MEKPEDLKLSVYFLAKKFVVDEMVRYTNAYPHMEGLLIRTTRNIGNVTVDQKERASGSSGYNLRKLLSTWVNGLTTFSIKPLRLAMVLGVLFAAIGFITIIVLVVMKLTRSDIAIGWTSMIATNLLTGGLDQLKGVESVPTFYAAKAFMGTAGLVVMVVTAISAIMTGIIGGYRATTRVLSTMAEDRILSEKFNKTSVSIVFIMMLAIILSIFGRNTLNWFVDLTSFGAIVGFGYTSAAAYKIAKTEGNRKVMMTGIIGALISVIFAIVQMVPRLTAMEAMGSEANLVLSL